MLSYLLMQQLHYSYYLTMKTVQILSVDERKKYAYIICLDTLKDVRYINEIILKTSL